MAMTLALNKINLFYSKASDLQRFGDSLRHLVPGSGREGKDFYHGFFLTLVSEVPILLDRTISKTILTSAFLELLS